MTTKVTHTMELAGDEIVLTEKVTFKADNPGLLRLLGVDGPITAEKYAEIKLDAVAPVVDAQPQQAGEAKGYTIVLDAVGTTQERKDGFHANGRLARALGKNKNYVAAKTLRKIGVAGFTKTKTGKIEIIGEDSLLRHRLPQGIGSVDAEAAAQLAGDSIAGAISPKVAKMLQEAPAGSQLVVAGSQKGLTAVLFEKPYYPTRGGYLPKA